MNSRLIDSMTKSSLHPRDNNVQAAKDVAFRFLTYRSRSQQEVLRKLEEKGFADEIIRRVIEDLKGLNYINDKEFAKEWSRQRVPIKFIGPILLTKELFTKGISPDITKKVVEETYKVINEVDLAMKAVQKRYRGDIQLESGKSKKQLIAFLQRRGFSYKVINEVVKKYFNLD